MGTEWNPQEVSKFPNLSVPGENRAKLRDNSSLVCPVSSKFTESCFIALMQYDWCKSRTIRLTNEASYLIAAVCKIQFGDKKPKENPRNAPHLRRGWRKMLSSCDHDMPSSAGLTWSSYAVESSSLAVVLDPIGGYESRERRYRIAEKSALVSHCREVCVEKNPWPLLVNKSGL